MKGHIPHFPPHFVDPFTGYEPTNEGQMSGLLGLFHQMGKVRWEKVPLQLPSNKPSGQMADALFAQTVMGGEYQLFWNSQEEMRLWGSMPADLIALSETDGRVVIIENKVGSGFTGVRDDPGAGQLAKQV